MKRLAALLSSFLVIPLHLAAAVPSVAQKAPDFSLSTPDGQKITLSERNARGVVALVMLRGYPGYQCPYCNRQVQDYIHRADDLAQAGAQIVLIYPGPPQNLNAEAKDFLAGKNLPENFVLLLDPDYRVTNLYGLRWNAEHETAYPATFLLDRNGIIFFSKVVKEHGARTTAAEILEALPKGK